VSCGIVYGAPFKTSDVGWAPPEAAACLQYGGWDVGDATRKAMKSTVRPQKLAEEAAGQI
jgi:hypothetical protein